MARIPLTLSELGVTFVVYGPSATAELLVYLKSVVNTHVIASELN